MSKRTDAREVAFKLIFEYLFIKEQDPVLFHELCDAMQLQGEEQYVHIVYNGVTEHIAELQKIVADTAIGFASDRIFKVDEAILLLALYEINYMTDIPYAVTINEAVNLAKKFSTPKSSSFINGILAKHKKA